LTFSNTLHVSTRAAQAGRVLGRQIVDAMFGLRLGDRPRMLIATTPRATPQANAVSTNFARSGGRVCKARASQPRSTAVTV
jgi:hypothetical protein